MSKVKCDWCRKMFPLYNARQNEITEIICPDCFKNEMNRKGFNRFHDLRHDSMASY